MSHSITHGTTRVNPQDLQGATSDGFDLDVTLLEITDAARLVNITGDNCGSTCGACTTGVA
ncbi:FxLD family lanthipeptide [Kitasatospora indigofera]|uniref:FxLD family lanthipeptide n=1 Tax=Kitasatospora indigofera TaxID=67307 RepID=UPI0033B5DB08